MQPIMPSNDEVPVTPMRTPGRYSVRVAKRQNDVAKQSLKEKLGDETFNHLLDLLKYEFSESIKEEVGEDVDTKLNQLNKPFKEYLDKVSSRLEKVEKRVEEIDTNRGSEISMLTEQFEGLSCKWEDMNTKYEEFESFKEDIDRVIDAKTITRLEVEIESLKNENQTLTEDNERWQRTASEWKEKFEVEMKKKDKLQNEFDECLVALYSKVQARRSRNADFRSGTTNESLHFCLHED